MRNKFARNAPELDEEYLNEDFDYVGFFEDMKRDREHGRNKKNFFPGE